MDCEQYGTSIWWTLYTEERLTSVVLKIRGGSASMVGAIGRRYKFWQDCNKGTAGVGVLISERWIDSVVNDRIMYVKLVIGKHIVNIVSAYAPQVGLIADCNFREHRGSYSCKSFHAICYV